MVPGRIPSFATLIPAGVARRYRHWHIVALSRLAIYSTLAKRAPLQRRSAAALSLSLATAVCVSACSSAPVGPGYYRVQRGDTLYSIARKQGQSGADLIRWNSLTDPNRIEVDQVLRVTPPTGETSSGLRTRGTETRADTSAPATARSPKRATRAAAPAAVPNTTVTPPASKDIALQWPAPGRIVTPFDGNRSKGLDIAGSVGEPVKAAAPGQVAYVGQLRGYGNLLIIKHDNGFLTSYAHLQKSSVKEGQRVTAGQAIAFIGNTEAAAPMLHFELRYNGQPVNPARYLPAR